MYLEKADLYRKIENLKEELNILPWIFPIYSKEIAKRYCVALHIEELDLDALSGILYRGHNETWIALNKNHSAQRQNFDCMHELIHYFIHMNLRKSFECISREDGKIRQNSFIEWQANEGAAEFLVPYQEFLPKVKEAYPFFDSYQAIRDFRK